jgi:nitrate reductase delta subunit
VENKTQPTLYKVASALLCYPSEELQSAIGEIRAALADAPDSLISLEPLLQHIESTDLIDLQESYVVVFDRNPSHSLHLFEHVYGEDRARGQAMVDLLGEYSKHGFDVLSDELPDYVPLFLEFLSTCDADESAALLGDAVHVLAHIGNKLKGSESLYASVFDIVIACSPVAAEPLNVPPIRDMDEALETFGPSAEGVEPLLSAHGNSQGIPEIAPIKFYNTSPKAKQSDRNTSI